jgi:hypothetical protein
MEPGSFTWRSFWTPCWYLRSNVIPSPIPHVVVSWSHVGSCHLQIWWEGLGNGGGTLSTLSDPVVKEIVFAVIVGPGLAPIDGGMDI